MRVVVALGGNALLRPGEALSLENQQRNLALAAKPLCRIAADNEVVITHGNGPQVGLLAQQDESMPLDVLDAETEGMLGHLIELELRSGLPQGIDVATVLTQVEIDPADPAFGQPQKPVGPYFDQVRADQLSRDRGWTFVASNRGLRRVVPSPEPGEILATPAIRRLLDGGSVVICAGGGGIPVHQMPSGRWQGVEAVIDKDLVSAVLATQLRADVLLLLTDVDAIYDNWGKAKAKPIRNVRAAVLNSVEFEPGTMRPKVEAAHRFVCSAEHGTRRFAAIGALKDAWRLLQGKAGTRID